MVLLCCTAVARIGKMSIRPLFPKLLHLGTHETCNNRDVWVGLVVSELFEVMDKRVVVGVNPRFCGVETDELETKRSHTSVCGIFYGVELGASDP